MYDTYTYIYILCIFHIIYIVDFILFLVYLTGRISQYGKIRREKIPDNSIYRKQKIKPDCACHPFVL